MIFILLFFVAVWGLAPTSPVKYIYIYYYYLSLLILVKNNNFQEMRCIFAIGVTLPITLLINCSREPVEEVKASQERAKAEEIPIVLPSPSKIASAFTRAKIKYIKGIEVSDNKPIPSNPPFKKIFYGMIGADFAYLSMNQQYDEAKKKFATLLQLTKELEPELEPTYMEFAQKYERIYNQTDSVIILLSKIQEQLDLNTELYKRYNAKSLYFIGGWIEGMYLGASGADTSSLEIFALIQEQFSYIQKFVDHLEKTEDAKSISDILNKIKEVINIYNNLPEIKSKPDTLINETVKLSPPSILQLKNSIINLRENVLKTL